jgi:hypothetical protein
MKQQLMELVLQSNLMEWRQTLAVLSTYGKSEEFAAISSALAGRLENELGDRDSATLCYMCASDVHRTVGYWTEEVKAANAALGYVDTIALQEYVEKVVIFTTANPFGKRSHCYKKIQQENTFFCNAHITYDFMESYNFSLNEYNPENSKDKIPFIKSKYENLRDFITINFGEDAFDSYKKFNKTGYFGIFSVTKEQIKLNSKEVYEKLLREVDIGNNNEVGHFIERMWMFLMYNKIKLKLK